MRTVDDLKNLWTLNNHEGDAQTIPHVIVVNQSYRGDDLELVVGKDCDLMQFTGLLDKNGKEIYEGDILEFDTWSGTKFVVRWEEDKAGFITWSPRKRVEIIGNIYETPNLLKV